MTVAFHLHHFSLDGISRVALLNADVFAHLGADVLLIVDTPPALHQFPLPPNTHVFLHLWDATHASPRARARWIADLLTLLKERDVSLWYEHAHFQYTLPSFPFAEALHAIRHTLKIPCIFHFHNSFASKVSCQKDAARFQAALARGIFQDGPHVVLTESHLDAALFRACGLPTLYVPNRLDPAWKPNPARRKSKTILFLARLEKVKQPLEALAIFRLVHAQEPEARLVVVGDGSLMGALQKEVRTHHLSDSVTFEGYQRDSLKYDQEAAVLLVTSSFEGFLMTALEAHACGTPVVMAALPNLELARLSKAIIPFQPGTRTQAARALLRLLQDPVYATKMHDEALRVAHNFATFNHAAFFENLWEDLRNGTWTPPPLAPEYMAEALTYTTHLLLQHRARIPEGVVRFCARIERLKQKMKTYREECLHRPRLSACLVGLLIVSCLMISSCVTRQPFKKNRPTPQDASPHDPTLTLVTGYCNCEKCCGWERSWFGWGQPVFASGPQKGQPKQIGRTASGTQAHTGTVAADARNFPFGTRLEIPGYGVGIVEDRGSAIQGNHLDVWFPSHAQALAWGRKWLKVKVLNPSGGSKK